MNCRQFVNQLKFSLIQLNQGIRQIFIFNLQNFHYQNLHYTVASSVCKSKQYCVLVMH